MRLSYGLLLCLSILLRRSRLLVDRRLDLRRRSFRHEVAAQSAGLRVHRLNIRLPTPQVLFGIVQNLASGIAMLECWAQITGNNRGVVEKV